jgi:GDPmannose 4,6-dehydratase
VALSFEQPSEALRSNTLSLLTVLEVCRTVRKIPKIYNAGSREIFGDTQLAPANELAPLHLRSPYALSKAAANWLVKHYREAYGMFACTGILFNHESNIRPESFVTKKVISAASRINKGSKEILELGNLTISRDWGWAPEYVEAMWLMLATSRVARYCNFNW